MEQAEVTGEWVARFRRSVRRWYARAGRDLPWTGDRDPYSVCVREIMLQQTTVTAVVPYLKRFLERFPTVEVLAAADEDEVLGTWEGLGYYARARNLQRAARMVVEEWDGKWAQAVTELESLPGVGRYTAGAIACFAFDQSAPIVEANTARLYARLMAMSLEVTSSRGRRQLWSLAERIVPPGRPGEFNQALMDLGATVCGVKPDCVNCPVRACCRALELGEVDRIPLRVSRPPPTDIFEVMTVIRRDASVLLVQHPSGERWGGLWGFPRLARSAAVQCDLAEARRIESDASVWGCEVEFGEWMETFRHGVTRFRLHLQPVQLVWRAGEWNGPETVEWVPLAELPSRPLSVAERRVARQAEKGIGCSEADPINAAGLSMEEHRLG